MTVGLEASPPAHTAGTPGSGIREDTFTLESWGWSSRPDECVPKIAALASLLNLAPGDAVVLTPRRADVPPSADVESEAGP